MFINCAAVQWVEFCVLSKRRDGNEFGVLVVRRSNMASLNCVLGGEAGNLIS